MTTQNNINEGNILLNELDMIDVRLGSIINFEALKSDWIFMVETAGFQRNSRNPFQTSIFSDTIFIA